MPTDVNQEKLALEHFITTRHFSFSEDFRNHFTSAYEGFVTGSLSLYDINTANEFFLMSICVIADHFYQQDAPMAHRLYAEYRLYCIGQRIRKQRKSLKLSQSELGRRLNRSLRSIQKYENGEVDCGLCLLEEIAIQLYTTPYSLLGFVDLTSPNASSYVCIYSYPYVDALFHNMMEEHEHG